MNDRVHELDSASLYPDVTVSRNVTPETVRWDCLSERSDLRDWARHPRG